LCVDAIICSRFGFQPDKNAERPFVKWDNALMPNAPSGINRNDVNVFFTPGKKKEFLKKHTTVLQ
jgi:hypothetical protein